MGKGSGFHKCVHNIGLSCKGTNQQYLENEEYQKAVLCDVEIGEIEQFTLGVELGFLGPGD